MRGTNFFEDMERDVVVQPVDHGHIPLRPIDDGQ